MPHKRKLTLTALAAMPFAIACGNQPPQHELGTHRAPLGAELYVCDSVADCNTNGGSGWSGTSADTGACDSKANPCKTLAYAFTQMGSGDTLVVGNGTYRGDYNRIYRDYQLEQSPPEGLGLDTMTLVRAEVDGHVVLDGEGTRNMFYLHGDSGSRLPKYQQYQGIQFVRCGSDPYGGVSQILNVASVSDEVPEGDLSDEYDAFIYVKSCGFHSSTGTTLNVIAVRSVLFEDCYTWGSGRYGVQIYVADRVTFRRHVDRRDDVQNSSHYPTASYINYAGHDVAFQNCLSIDVNSSHWSDNQDPFGGFYVRETYEFGSSPTKYRSSERTSLRGCMVVNFDATTSPHGSYLGGIYTKQTVPDTSLRDCLILGSSSGFLVGNLAQTVTYDHCSVIAADHDTEHRQYAFGDISQSGTDRMVVTNSMACGNSLMAAGYGLGASSHHNNGFGNASDSFGTGGQDTTDDPLLKYPVRMEPESPNTGTASDGENRGAELLMRYGADGSFHGHADHDGLTGVALWPWAGEQVIRAAFLTDYGTAEGDREARGFTTGTSMDGSPQTLTKYIWEYLGEQIPNDVYGSAGAAGSAGASGSAGTAGSTGDAGQAGSAGSPDMDGVSPGTSNDDDSGCGCRFQASRSRDGALVILLLLAVCARRTSVRETRSSTRLSPWKTRMSCKTNSSQKRQHDSTARTQST